MNIRVLSGHGISDEDRFVVIGNGFQNVALQDRSPVHAADDLPVLDENDAFQRDQKNHDQHGQQKVLDKEGKERHKDDVAVAFAVR